MGHHFRNGMPTQKTNIFAALNKSFKYMKKSVPLIFLSLILASVGSILTILGPRKIGDITTLMQQGLYTTIDMKAISKIGVYLLIIYLLSTLFMFLQHYILATVTLDASKRMRQDLADKINKVPISYFNTTTQGDILSRITNDVQTLQQGLVNSMPGMIIAIAQFVGCLIMMFVTEWRLALCVIGVSLIGMFLLMLIMKHSQKYFIQRQESLGSLNGFIEEMYSGHEIIRISRASKKIKGEFDGLNSAVYDANWKSQFLSGVMQPLMTVIGNVGYVVVCVVGAALAMNGKIEFGVIVAFIMFCRLFTSPLVQLAQSMTNMQTAAASADRIFDFLSADELSDETQKTKKLDTAKGEVEFKHVHFAYPDTPDKIIIKDFSASVTPGQKVAIVGPTGAGKTTMVNLLMRFFEINSGEILIDGVPTNQLKRENIHNLFSMVLQDTWLFDGTVRENLVYNMDGISDNDLERVCKACGLSHFVHSLPQGFDTVLTDSTMISSGQKQLLTIARAMLQNSPMLILDEATSSVDTRTELLIQRAMDKLADGRTSFVIAHRLSTIKNADLILVMKDGDVIESGNHNELMAKGGFYSDLYNSQFENGVAHSVED